jgi:hypothetical protein
VVRVHPADALCDQDRCHVVEDGTSLYWDDDHLSPAGARLVAKLFEPVFARVTAGND